MVVKRRAGGRHGSHYHHTCPLICPRTVPEIVAPLPAQCPNCAAPVHGPWCAQCGQETVITIPRWRDFAHEYATQFVSFEGRLWRTLWLLLSRPVQLSLEFLAGRRRRFVRPLPLYLSFSFLFFLLVALFPGEALDVRTDLPSETDAAVAQAQASAAPTLAQGKAVLEQASAVATEHPAEIDAQTASLLQTYFPNYKKTLLRLETDPQNARRRLTDAFVAKLPVAVFALVPFFALGGALLLRKRRRDYMEHLLLALHMHAFVFLTLALIYLLPGDGKMFLVIAAWWLYLALAWRRVFGGRLWVQLLRSGTLLICHGTLLGLACIVALLLAVPAI